MLGLWSESVGVSRRKDKGGASFLAVLALVAIVVPILNQAVPATISPRFHIPPSFANQTVVGLVNVSKEIA